MNPKYWDTLELPAILQRLSSYASFSAGKTLALALSPSSNADEVQYWLAETTEAQRIREIKSDVTLGGVHDLRPFVENALRGARLLPQDLLDTFSTLRRAQLLQRSIARQQDQFPILANIAYQLESCPDLMREIERCIDEYGQVSDGASAALSRIRSELKIAYDRLMDKLNRLLANPDNASHLQESYITQRDGRYVVPLRSQSRGRIPGLVHDQSASGATLFIEPLATVDLNNSYRELQLEERREVDRILLVLSGMVAEQAETITTTVSALAQLDLALAKAKYAEAIRATAPEIVPFQQPRGTTGSRGAASNRTVIDLRQARHPLLDPQTVVPIDVQLGDHLIVVITGPNTGGKTVSLKTVGLLALMAQCGLHIPVAEGSRLTVFDNICADIGDEQSIEQSLSTFSSHITNIIDILQSADHRSLVLLDELGAGTDPVEGAALAQSLLMHLLQRRVTAIVTTHHPELKLFAHHTPSVTNACVEFDIESLSPTFKLTVGLPGHSNAFSIAKRLGLPNAIVHRAESMVSDDVLSTERFLSEIKTLREETEQVRLRMEAQQAEVASLKNDLHERLLHIENERQDVLSQAREQAAQELEDIRRELRAVRHKMAPGSGGSTTAARIEADLDALAKQVSSSARQALEPEAQPAPADGEIDIGDTVWIPDLNTTGELSAVDGFAAEVQVGAFRVRTRRHALQLRHKRAAQQTQEPERRVSVPPVPDVSLELHLRGLRVADGLQRLEKYLDSAYRAQAPFVRIVHGKGTGKLKQAVRDALRTHPLIASFRDGAEGEGDTGVTVVKFK
ncbi:MAG: endonuclease MutS2 [Anaerolineae bacterium]|nr:endonuclease MutS2 [Anaerolineae bacterium]